MGSGSESTDVAAMFERYFSVMPATNDDLLSAAYKLRYQVYCVEHSFLDPALQRDERERDEFDDQARHAVLVYNPSKDVVGCVRLVIPTPQDPNGMPIHALLSDECRARLAEYPLGSLAEISRYAVSKRFRRREGEELYPDVEMTTSEYADTRRLVPHISLGLFRAVALLAAQQDVTVVCAAMAPSLLRLLRKFGFEFESLGPPVEYHGLRQPCLAEVSSLVRGITMNDPSYGAFVTNR